MTRVLTTHDCCFYSQEEERDAEARQEHEQLREEIRNKNLEEINVLRITLDTQIEELEQHFETAHINYLQNTDQRTTGEQWLALTVKCCLSVYRDDGLTSQSRVARSRMCRYVVSLSSKSTSSADNGISSP